MPLAAYRDVNFFVRAVRVLPVIAVAAAIGGIIGGFTVYAIDSALTWPSRPDLRADNQSGSQSSAAADQQKTRPVRVVGGAILDPSAGMSAPPPVQSQQSTQEQSTTQQNPAQLSPQILTAKPLGPPTALQAGKDPQAAKTVQTEKIPASNTAATAQQATRWPDALSRAQHDPPTVQQQTTAPAPNVAPEPAAGKTAEGNNSDNARAASIDDQDRATSRRGRHGRRYDARAYDRVYNSYGNPRDQDAAAGSGSRYDSERRYGRYSRYRSRSREIVPDRQDIHQGADRADRGQGDRDQRTETARPRPEPFWGGGYRSRGFQDDE